MKENVLARRYARALFELAKERKILTNIRHEMEFFDESIDKNQDLRLLLSSHEISKKEKIKTIEKLLQDRVSNVFFNFILLLLKKNREVLYSAIAREFGVLFDKFNKRVRAKTITAVPLDAKLIYTLKNRLDRAYSADVQIDSLTDPSILGGIIVNVEGQVFDGSLQSQLSRLRYQLTEKINSRMR
ncbi:MAG: ATP synthase F1 subunit delta [bacterium]